MERVFNFIACVSLFIGLIWAFIFIVIGIIPIALMSLVGLCNMRIKDFCEYVEKKTGWLG